MSECKKSSIPRSLRRFRRGKIDAVFGAQPLGLLGRNGIEPLPFSGSDKVHAFGRYNGPHILGKHSRRNSECSASIGNDLRITEKDPDVSSHFPHKRAVFDALENDGGKERPRIGKDGECGSSRSRTDGAYACDQGDQNEKGTGADGTALKGVLAGFGRPA